MKRLLTGTAVGLLLGLTPALAQTDMPADETQTPPALEQPAMPSETIPSETMPADPSEPAQPIPDLSSDPSSTPDAAPAMKSTDAPKSIAPPKDAAEIPSITPHSVTTATVEGGQFLTRQEPNDWLASNMIGKSVHNAKNESIGNVNDLVTDENGKVVAVLVGVGGFLGLGQKDVAVRFESLKFARDENSNVKVLADMTDAMLASAPDYKRLDEQALTVGELNEDEDATKEKTEPSAY